MFVDVRWVSFLPPRSFPYSRVSDKEKKKFYGIDTRGCLGQRRWPHRCCCPLPAAGSLRGALGRRMTRQNFGMDSSFLVGGLIFSLFLILIFCETHSGKELLHPLYFDLVQLVLTSLVLNSTGWHKALPINVFRQLRKYLSDTNTQA
jgi:hypothetical protein